MENKSYTATIELALSPQDVFNAITDVPNWWTKDFEGTSTNLHDEFIVDHPNQHYSKQKLVEVIPGERIIWLVTESYLNWIKNNKEEWTGTKMIFEITTQADKTLLRFVHEGLTPEKECYAMCEMGWGMIIKDWLFHLITTGQASQEMDKAAAIRNQRLQTNEIKNNNYHRSFIINASAGEAMRKISQVNRWWIKDFKGSAAKLNDKFTVLFTDPSFVDFTITEYAPGTRIVWKVTDCFLPWFQDKKEWNNTEIVFELIQEKDERKLEFTHAGLNTSLECYEVCEKGWDGHINTLIKFINDGVGLPE